ncbi:MAG: type II secretion system F family protein, partial [Candidatus Omnitrophica bacterium]|nr:type II secretion system F family protein [Candidatus Omnitrophota bacterium]
MPNFKYKARDKFARAVSGEVVADDSAQAARKLQEMGYVPVFIDEVRFLRGASILDKFQRVSLYELSGFTRQLYALQKAGLPLLSSLTALSAQAKNTFFKKVIDDISRDIRGGLSFSEALRKYPRVFDNIYISMVHAAESGGNLANILERLATLIEQDMDTKNRIKGATRYPMIAFFVLCLGFTIVVTFVIPRFAMVYSHFNALLPLPTRILIAINVAIQHYWYIFLIIVTGLVIGFIQFLKTPFGRSIWDNIRLKVPVFGPLVTMLTMSRFTRITAILMKSGVPILEVLELSARTSGNVIIARAILNIKESVSQGKGISEPMKVSGLFPEAVVQMVAVGEQTGKVDELLLSVADYYDLESGYMIKNLTTYIEPILIFILAL